MKLKEALQQSSGFDNLELLANQVVEGFISGMHKSPFHGFSAEFAEHKIYNPGESTKHIDWKLYAKTDKFYTKQYEEETNLRSHFIIDNSSSMHFPEIDNLTLDKLNKIGFSALATAALMKLLQRQRDAAGLSIYSDQYEFYAPERNSERHYHLLLNKLNDIVVSKNENKKTETYTYLHQIAEKLNRRSLIFLFTDMFQEEKAQEKLFEALHHLKYNKHQVILFHTFDGSKELNFSFDNTPKRFIDKETGERIDLFSDTVRKAYTQSTEQYFKNIKLQCLKYKIKYVAADIQNGFNRILSTYLIESQKFL